MGDPLVTPPECNRDMAQIQLTPAETLDLLGLLQEHYQRAMLMTARALWFEADDAQMRAEVVLQRLERDCQARG